MGKRTIASLSIGIVAMWAAALPAENFTLRGDMGATIRYELQERITTGDGVRKLVLSFVVPQSYSSPTYRQEIQDFDLVFQPTPQEKTRGRDSRGNDIITATWTSPPAAIDVKLNCSALNATQLPTLETESPFPLGPTDPTMRDYLRPTELVQADDSRIRKLARELTADVKTEFDAVQRIISWVVDHIRYVNPPERYDALYSLDSGKGNCQNYSHLSAALLRNIGVPTRIVNGFTLNQPYNVAWKKGVLTFKMGQGRHSWIEVWFPDLGWVPFDPQNTVLFVSNRYIRIEVGVDNHETKNDGLLRWVQLQDAAEQPTLQENIAAQFGSDRVSIKGDQQAYGPKSILLSPNVRSAFKQIERKPTPPPPVIPAEERKRLKFQVPIRFGNMEFPEDIDFAFPRTTKASGKNSFEMSKNFLVETAEYVTSKRTQYAQIFVTRKPVKLEKIGLALHNFGGEGMLWLDILQDENGKPGKPLSSSQLIDLSQLSQRPGYRWADFDFRREAPELMPGQYWIALGFTGSPIVNWYFTYGKPVGPLDGTRYKDAFEEDWSGAMNYEFNYRVVGLTVR